MFCRNCGTQITRENVKFCTKCGHPLNNASLQNNGGGSTTMAPPQSPSAGGQYIQQNTAAATLPRVKIKLNPVVIAVIAALALLLAAIPVVQYLLKPATPQKIAKNFFKEIKAGNYEKAYTYLDKSSLTGEQFLGAQEFSQYFKDIKLTDFNVIDNKDNVNFSKLSEYEVSIDVTVNNEKSQDSIRLVKVAEGKSKKWKIDPSIFTAVTEIYTYPGLNVEINGKKITLSNDTAQVKMFNSYSFKIKVSGTDIQTVEKDETAGNYIQITDFVPSDELKTKLTELVNKYLTASIDAYKAMSINPMEPYIKKDSSIWYKYSSYFSMGTIPEDRTFKNVNFGDISFTSTYNGELKYININADETWVFGTYESNSRWTYSVEKQPDGSWLLTDFYERYY